MTEAISILAVPGVPDIFPGDDLAQILGDCLEASGAGVQDGDILCIAHKVFSKAEGKIVNVADVKPSEEAKRYARELNKDPRKVEVVLGQSARVVRAFKHPKQEVGVMICEHKLGFISANAAVDESNLAGEDELITLPDDPDQSALLFQQALESRFKCRLGVVISDTFGRPWRLGQVNFAIGLAGVPATVSEKGKKDAWGRELTVTEPAFADEIAAASGLAVQKAAKTPMVLFRGLHWETRVPSNARDILRHQKEDMFK